jgi:agmatine deiminase
LNQGKALTLTKEKASQPNTKEDNNCVTIGLIQTKASENAYENTSKTISKIAEAAKKGAQIVCLQELFQTQYFPQQENQKVQNLSETIPGRTTNKLCEIAQKYKLVIIAPIFEKEQNDKYFNTAVVIDANGKILGKYRKVHIPNDPFFYEKTYFEQGNNRFETFKTKYATIGVLICYDQWFPEPARILALKGAQIIFYPTAIGYINDHNSTDGNWNEAWKTVQRAHAIENGVHVAAVNRVGQEGQLKFWGDSFVCDSFGEMLKQASKEKEEILVVEVDLEKNKRIQEGWGFFENRRPDTYKEITE